MEQLHIIKDYGVKGAELQTSLSVGDYEVYKDPELKDVIFHHSWYFTKALRDAHKKGNVTATPQNSHEWVNKNFRAYQGEEWYCCAAVHLWISMDICLFPCVICMKSSW